jgi:hypothetical protein
VEKRAVTPAEKYGRMFGFQGSNDDFGKSFRGALSKSGWK